MNWYLHSWHSWLNSWFVPHGGSPGSHPGHHRFWSSSTVVLASSSIIPCLSIQQRHIPTYALFVETHKHIRNHKHRQRQTETEISRNQAWVDTETDGCNGIHGQELSGNGQELCTHLCNALQRRSKGEERNSCFETTLTEGIRATMNPSIISAMSWGCFGVNRTCTSTAGLTTSGFCLKVGFWVNHQLIQTYPDDLMTITGGIDKPIFQLHFFWLNPHS